MKKEDAIKILDMISKEMKRINRSYFVEKLNEVSDFIDKNFKN